METISEALKQRIKDREAIRIKNPIVGYPKTIIDPPAIVGLPDKVEPVPAIIGLKSNHSRLY